MSTKMTAGALRERLRASLVKPGDAMPGGMFMAEVALGSRRIDGLYCGFFGSRGKFLRGYEIKVARSDWLAELDQPAKAETWEQNVHEWWIVAPDTDVVRPEELPHGWGLLIPDPNPRTKTRMQVVVKATRYPDRTPSWEAVHAIVQKADTERMNAIGDIRRQAQADANATIEERVEQRVAAATGDSLVTAERDRLAEAVRQIEFHLGMKLESGYWRSNEIAIDELGGAFRRFLAADRDANNAVKYERRQLQHVVDAVQRAQDALAKFEQGGDQP